MKFIIMTTAVLGIIAPHYRLVWPQSTRNVQAVAGVSSNIHFQCFGIAISISDTFWIINGSVYGLLQVPGDFTVCSSEVCDPTTLGIPVVRSEMDGYTFQCVSIDYHNNTVYLGDVTLLEVTSLPPSFNITLMNATARDVLELSYPQFSVGAVNTSIGWTYSSLTCHPSVFAIQGFADRDAIPDQLDTPTLTLTSTSSVLTFPTNITNGSLHWRLLAHDVSGTPCAQDSALRYYHLDSNVTPALIPPSSDGVWCVPIPVGRVYSSLEVVWPERRDTVGRLCYCPPFEGEQHLFSRCISTTSCDTDYSITVSNGSVCFAELSPPPTSIPVYFTLLESCADSRCVIRSVLASFIIVFEHSTLPVLDSTTVEETTSTEASNFLESTKEDKDTGTTTPPKSIPGLLIVAIFMGALFLTVLLSFPLTVVSCCCYRMKQNSSTQQLQHGNEDLSPPPSPPHMLHQDLTNFQAPEYEDIQEVQVIRSTNLPGSGLLSGTPNTVADYTYTECPAYSASGQPSLTTATEATDDPSLPTNLQGHRYEDVQELQPYPSMVACPAYTASGQTSQNTRTEVTDDLSPQGHQYEDLQELQPYPSMVADYMYTQCPAYATSGQTSQNTGTEAIDDPSPYTPPHGDSANFHGHQYEDVQELQATSSANPFSSSQSAVDYIFTQCPAYAVSVQALQNTGTVATDDPSLHPLPDPVNLRPHEYEDIQEMHATNPFSSLPLAAGYTYTQCPAYAASLQNTGPVAAVTDDPSLHPLPDPVNLRPHEYEDIQEMRTTRSTNPSSSPPPNMAADTQCPAYTTSH